MNALLGSGRPGDEEKGGRRKTEGKESKGDNERQRRGGGKRSEEKEGLGFHLACEFGFGFAVVKRPW